MEIDPDWTSTKEYFFVRKMSDAIQQRDFAMIKDILETAKHAYEKDGSKVYLNMFPTFEGFIERRDFEMAQYLIDNGFPFAGIIDGIYSYVELFYNYDYLHDESHISDEEKTADPTDVFEFYVKNGVSVNFVCAYNSKTALDLAIEGRYTMIEQVLRRMGAKRGEEVLAEETD